MNRVWTAAEFEALSVAEQDAVYRASIAWDLEQAPADVVARARVQERIALEELRDAL